MRQYIHLLASFSVSLIRWLQWEVAERWSRFTPRSSPSCVSCADFLIFSFALRLVKLPWNFSALNYCGQLSWTSRAIAISRWWTTASTMSHSRSIASLFRDVRLRIPAFCLLKIEPGLVFEEKKIKGKINFIASKDHEIRKIPLKYLCHVKYHKKERSVYPKLPFCCGLA